MTRIAVFIANYTIGNSPSIINLLDFISDHYKVDLFLRNVRLTKITLFNKKRIRVINIGNRKFLSYAKAKLKASWPIYRHYIAFDPHGFILCKELFHHSRPIYYSLELYLKDDHYGLNYPKEVMEQERNLIHTIRGLIIQSKEKEILFRDDYNLPTNIPSLLIPVTYKGQAVKRRSSDIKEKYRIRNDQKVALHLGGIASWFSCIELALAFSKFKNWVLFFHGYPENKYLEELKNVLSKNRIGNVLISEETYNELEQVNQILISCDLGIAWYNDISIGFRVAGKSSGKIASYMRFGLPVIAKKYASTVEAIEQTGCGICVDNFDEIAQAITRIEKEYKNFAINAWNEYEKTYRFENYKRDLIDFIEMTTSQGKSFQCWRIHDAL